MQLKTVRIVGCLLLMGLLCEQLFAGGCPAASLSIPASENVDSARVDTARLDTLREVMVMGDSMKLAPVKSAIEESMKRNAVPHVPSLGELLNRVAPNTMDYILHPFGFSERKRKKKRKKVRQVLEEYDRAGQPNPFRVQMDSILKVEGLMR